MLRVYIASPYTIGNKRDNVNRQIDVAEQLANHGILPFWPLSSHYWHCRHPHDYEFWMQLDFEEIRRSDAVLRLGGKSAGADREIEFAASIGLPVFFSVWDVIEWSKASVEECEKKRR